MPKTRTKYNVLELENKLANLVHSVSRKFNQPVTAIEVGHASGVNPHTARNYLSRLVESGELLSRIETKAEKMVRYGSEQLPAGFSVLYFSGADSSVVPERTERDVVGFTVSFNGRNTGPRGLTRQRVLDALSNGKLASAHRVGKRARITAAVARNMLDTLAREGLVVASDLGFVKDSGYVHYRLATPASPPVKNTSAVGAIAVYPNGAQTSVTVPQNQSYINVNPGPALDAPAIAKLISAEVARHLGIEPNEAESELEQTKAELARLRAKLAELAAE